MDALAGKHKRNENERKRKRQNSEIRVSSSCKTEKHQRLVNETIGENEAPSISTFYNLPLEMLDMILQKSYLHWILNSSTMLRDEEVVRSLISVDVCFYRRITRQRFKKAIWRYLKDFHTETKKRYAIIRDNRNYLLENIQPNDELIASLLSLNCITEEQRNFIQRQRSNRERNDKLLYAVEPLDEAKWSNFVKSLRQTKQKTVARIIENGGGVIKMQVQTRGAQCSTSRESQLLHKHIEGLRNRTKPWPFKTNKLISQLREKDIEILNFQLDRQTVVVWIWCRSQATLEHFQSLYESNQLRDLFFESIQLYISMVINIDRNQFKKTVVTRPISISFSHRIQLSGNGFLFGVTKLRNEIYVLSRPFSSRQVIFVFEDQNPFGLHEEIKIKEINFLEDMASSEKGNCLYVSDSLESCVWKITIETDDQHKIIKWLTTDYRPETLSVSNDGQLLMVNSSSSILMIYGSDAELLRSIRLPTDIETPLYAVETSIGNFIIVIHSWEEEEGESASSGRGRVTKWGICELTKDGQMVIRRFSPSNKTQKLNETYYISLDSEDRVFVADRLNGRVILLDSDLSWNQILCPTKERKERKIRMPWRLCYDEEKKQLIVAEYLGKEVNVYTLIRK